MSEKQKVILSRTQLDEAILSALYILKAIDPQSGVSINVTLTRLKKTRIGTTHSRVGQRLESLRADRFVEKDKRSYYFLLNKGIKKAQEIGNERLESREKGKLQ
jgi:hypothetical protein